MKRCNWTKTAGLLFVLCLVSHGEVFGEGMLIYLTRHAESMGNVTGDYTAENQRTFSPKGKKQVEELVDKLAPYTFDAIYVSPTWRTQHTILPYLKENDLVGEIMPEIEECCCDVGYAVVPAENIPLGKEVEIIPEGRKWLKVREDGRRRYEPGNWEEGIGQLKKGLDRLKSEFSQSGKSVLLMSHSCTGARIMELLLDLAPVGRFAPDNAGLTLLKEQPDGSFRLMIYNEEPFEQKYEWQAVTDARPFKPGDPLIFALYPEPFATPATDGYVLKWKVLDSKEIVQSEGRLAFAVVDSEKAELARLEVSTEGAFYGNVWVLESTLYDGDKEVTSWKHPFLIPSYKSLTGKWLIKKGDDPSYADKDYDDRAWKWTVVPGGWERDALPGYDGIAWYRLQFRLTEEDFKPWEQHPLAVAFGAIDDADEAYLNGKLIGRSGAFPPEEVTAWNQPRVYRFDRRHLSRDNVLAVRVSDWGGGGGIWQGPVAVGPAKELEKAVELAPTRN